MCCSTVKQRCMGLGLPLGLFDTSCGESWAALVWAMLAVELGCGCVLLVGDVREVAAERARKCSS